MDNKGNNFQSKPIELLNSNANSKPVANNKVSKKSNNKHLKFDSSENTRVQNIYFENMTEEEEKEYLSSFTKAGREKARKRRQEYLDECDD